MNSQKTERHALPLVFKALCLVLVGFLFLLGLVGLVLPIIPGILFLFLAAILLAKISDRFDSLLNSNKELRYWRRRWNTTNSLPLLQRVKLSFWMIAKALVNGVEVGVDTLKRGQTKS